MKKYLLLIIIIVLSNCSSVNNKDKVTVTFWHAMGGKLGSVLDSLVDEFNATHTGIYIDATAVGHYGALAQKLMASVMAKKPPVLAQVFGSWTDQFREAEVIVPLNKFAFSEDGYNEEEIEDFYKTIWQNNLWQDTLWSMPFNKSLPVIFYNLDYFDSIGEIFPETWEEFVEVCIKFKEKNNNYAFGLPINTWMFETILFQLGGELLDEEKRKVSFDDDKGILALKILIELIDENVCYLSSGYEHQDEFIANRTLLAWGSVVSYSFMIMKNPEFKIAVAPLPHKECGKGAFVISGTNVTIFSQATIEQRRAAWEFIKWFNSPEVQAVWSLKTGYIPTRRSSLSNIDLKKHLESIPGMLEIYEKLDYAVSEPRMSEWFAGRIFLAEALEYSLREVATPEISLKRAAVKLQHELDN